MKITIGERGQSAIDVSRRLKADSDIELYQERERDAFQRIVDDLKFTVSNADGSMKTMFFSKPAQTYWEVNVYDGRKIFNGRIQSPITFDLNAKWCTIRVFSIDKIFWDLCKAQKISRLGQENSVFMTLRLLLFKELMADTSKPLLQLGITEFDIDPLFIDRPIRDQADTDILDVGNGGKYKDLDPEMTTYELLNAISLYYNAEFFIDVEKNAFCMRPRMSVVSDTEYDLDAVISGDGPLEVDDIDQTKFDYIQSYISLPKPEKPTIIDTVQLPLHDLNGFKSTILGYLITNVFGKNGLEIESGHSDASATVIVFDKSQLGYRFNATVRVPVGPAGVSARCIYRWNGNNDNRLVGVINNNTQTEFIDTMSTEEAFNSKILNLDPVKGKIYYRYDEELGRWDEPIQQIETSAPPSGNIFEILPALRFIDKTTGATIVNSVYHVYFFFGNENNLDLTARQWVDLFRMRRPLRCICRGTNYKYGDSFVSSKKYPGKYAVKKAVNRYMKKETELTLVTV